MSDSITVVGTVATDLRHVKTDDKLEVTTFRLASAHRRFDRKEQKWIDGETNWYTIVAFRQLASNAAESIKKGDRVIAFGRPRVRNWSNETRSGTTMEVEVDGLGHDLLWGRTEYTRTALSRSPEPDVPAADETPAGEAAAPADPPSQVDEHEMAPAF